MIEIVSKTKDFVVIFKPSGMPSQSDPTGTLDAMTALKTLMTEQGERDELYLIHRLDRVVGGLLVYARNKQSAAWLSRLVADRLIDKEYFAVVEGTAESGILKDYIYKDATLNKAFVVDKKRAGVKDAELEYNALATVEIENRTLTLVRIKLKTGRFHQIRAQFASRKMPLIGDKKYGSRDFKAKTPSLFATSLEFDYKGERVKYSRVPELSEYPWSLFDKELFL